MGVAVPVLRTGNLDRDDYEIEVYTQRLDPPRYAFEVWVGDRSDTCEDLVDPVEAYHVAVQFVMARFGLEE
jgi:hypothetical protein